MPTSPAASSFKLLTELLNLVGQRPVDRRSLEEVTHPPHAIRRRPLTDQPVPQKVLTKALQRGLGLSHDFDPSKTETTLRQFMIRASGSLIPKLGQPELTPGPQEPACCLTTEFPG